MRSQSQLSGLKHKRREDPELRKLSEFGSVCRAEKTGVLALSSLPFFTRGWNGFGIFLRTFESVKLLFLAGIYLLFSRFFLNVCWWLTAFFVRYIIGNFLYYLYCFCSANASMIINDIIIKLSFISSSIAFFIIIIAILLWWLYDDYCCHRCEQWPI